MGTVSDPDAALTPLAMSINALGQWPNLHALLYTARQAAKYTEPNMDDEAAIVVEWICDICMKVVSERRFRAGFVLMYRIRDSGEDNGHDSLGASHTTVWRLHDARVPSKQGRVKGCWSVWEPHGTSFIA